MVIASVTIRFSAATWIAFIWALGWLLVLGLRVPLGVPGEWTWDYRGDARFDPFGILLTILALMGLCALAGREGKHPVKRRHFLWGALLLLTVFRTTVALLLPMEWRPVPIFWALVIASPIATSFYDEARNLQQQGLRTYLRYYHEQLPAKPFHAATHPPGLPMLFALWRQIGLHPVLQRLVPIGQEELLVMRRIYQRIFPPLKSDTLYPTDADLKAAWWVAVFCLACGILAALLWAWYWVRETGRVAPVALVATTPATLWWQPTTDSIHFLVIMLVFVSAWQWERHRSWGWAFLTGTMAGVALWLAFKNAVPLACISLWLLWAHWKGESRIPFLQGLTVVLLTLAPYLLAWLLAGFQPLETLMVAREAHHVQAGAHARSYLPWLLVNLADWAMGLGGAWLGLTLVALVHWWREGRFPSLTIATLVVLLGLNFSGLVRGEAARLWLPLIPLFVWEGRKHLPENGHELALMAFLQGGLAIALQLRLEFLRPF